jgi:serine/threonine-protein kinase
MAQVGSTTLTWAEEVSAPGRIIVERFRVDGVLGQGGMGLVLAAQDLVEGRPVALKFLSPAHARRVQSWKRFEREAQVASDLASDHVVRLLDTGRDETGTPFLVLERLVGEDLARWLERFPVGMPLGQAAGIVSSVCAVMQRAHEAGIVHRDLKPSNLFLARTAAGALQLKVLDFGISKLMDTTPGSLRDLTRVGEVMGSPPYMSPEQLEEARSVDHRTDVWSIGVVLYELLSAEVPFPGHTVPAVFAAISVGSYDAVTELRPELPAELDTIISRCLERHAEARYQSMSELAAALAPYAEGTTIPLTGSLPRRSFATDETAPGGSTGQAKSTENRILETLAAKFSAANYRPPRLPAAAIRLFQLTRSPNASVQEMVRTVEAEPMLAAELLRLAQSATFGASGLRTLEDAIVRIGFQRATELFMEIALSTKVFRARAFNGPLESLRKHSVATASLARLVSRETAIYDEHAYLCGLLHDVGGVAALIALSDATLSEPLPDFSVVWSAVQRIHAEASALLARLWNLPDEIRLVIEHHHDLEIDGRVHPTAATVHVANWMAAELGHGFDPTDESNLRKALDALAINTQTLERLMRQGAELLRDLPGLMDPTTATARASRG